LLLYWLYSLNWSLLLYGKIIECVVLLLRVAFLVIIERKLLGGLQLRTGPLFVGFNGLVQTVIDGLKLLTKEVI